MEKLKAHALRYPSWTAQDILKLMYQRYLGCGHFAPDEASARERLLREWDATPADRQQPLCEPLGGGYARLHLAAAKAAGVPLSLILRLFLASAVLPSTQQIQQLHTALQQVDPLALGIDPIAWSDAQQAWKDAGYSPPGHSEAYRAAYCPAYRVIKASYAHWLPLLIDVAERLTHKTPFTLVMDGRSGSGKSCFAACLQAVFQASIVHMDDFFLPPARKTPERLAQPGANVDLERFAAEVSPSLRTGQQITYRPYSCQTGVLCQPITLPVSQLVVVEGVYSMNPALDFPYDASIFLTVAPEIQSARILQRNGADMLRRFQQEWIPLEEMYFSALQVPDRADLCYDTALERLTQPGQER